MLPSPFQHWYTYPGHGGIDFPNPEGTPIYASADGHVTVSGLLNSRAGYGIRVTYPGYPNFMYCHQPKNGFRLATGASFKKGDRIGTVGWTGHVVPANTAGSHLHLEVMEGNGAHTANGVWLYFDKDNWVGKETPSGGGSKPVIDNEDEDEMYIANVKNGNFYLVLGTKAHALGANSGARESKIPIINYPDDWAVQQLKTVVSGITQ